MWKCFLLVAGGMLSAAAIADEVPASVGIIRGVALDENLRPLAAAQVWAEPADGLLRGMINFVDSDADGHFSIDHLPLGTYNVFAKKEDEGYPMIDFEFYRPGRPPTVTLSTSKPVASTVVTLGPKAGTLTGAITDAVTGAPVGAAFRMWHLNKEHADLSTSVASDYRVLIPPDVDVVLEVHADGYETWYYPGYGAAASGPLRLRPGERMSLGIKLQPKLPAPPGK